MSSGAKYFLIGAVLALVICLVIQNTDLRVRVAELQAENDANANQNKPIESLAVSTAIEPARSHSIEPIETVAIETSPVQAPAMAVPGAIVEAQAAEPVPETDPDFHHSEDFTTVYHGGERYALTNNQAIVVQKLYEAHKNKTPEVHQGALLEGLGIYSKRLRDVFKTNIKAFKILFAHGERRGTFRLTFTV